MRRVDRKKVSAPASLGIGGAGPAELVRLRAYRANLDPNKKPFPYAAYKGDDVKYALETLFHGKCAYCETAYASSAPVDVEHYRPKGAVSEDDTHGGYWWIAMTWSNLLPSCIDCNRKRGQAIVTISTKLAELAGNAEPLHQSGKHDSFPLADGGIRTLAESEDFRAERPLLLNPCDDDPVACLAYNFDPAHPTGLILPRGTVAEQERGAVSIQIYGLNRLKLVQDRTRLLRRLEFLGDLVIDLSRSIDDLDAPAAVAQLANTPAEHVAPRLRLLRDRTLAEIKSFGDDDAPYSSMARAWISAFKARVAA